MKDLILDRSHKRGDSGDKVRLIQEWLCLHGFSIPVDGEFGAATDLAVKQFQQKMSLAVDGEVGNNTFSILVQPMVRAIEKMQAVRSHTSIGSLVAAYAMQHLRQSPREVGGQNMGPWVRYYTGGYQGKEYAWCAGFVCTILRQACETLELEMPVPFTLSCDTLAIEAKKAGLFVPETEARGKARIGSLFLVRRTDSDWTHVGIVTQAQADADAFSTIEGNTNDSGDREGYEVCERARGYGKKEFIVWR